MARHCPPDEQFVRQLPELLSAVSSTGLFWRESSFLELHDPSGEGDAVFVTMASRPAVRGARGLGVGASMMVARTERGDRLFLTMAARHARHALDLGPADVLAG